MRTLNLITLFLLIIGGLNWLSVALAREDVVAVLFGLDTLLSRAIYFLVGVSAIWQLIPFVKAVNGGRAEVEVERAR